MKVLITRPQPAAQALARALRGCGHVAVVRPALCIHACAPTAASLAGVAQAGWFVFVSGNAVRHGWPHVAVRAPDRAVRWAAVGPRTAATLHARGVEVLAPAAPGSAAALLELPALRALAGEQVVIVRGTTGLDTLRTVLSGRGAQVIDLAVYERRPAPVEPLADALTEGSDVIVVSSGEGLAALLAAAAHGGASLAGVTVIAPSARIALLARRAGLTRVALSAGADDAAVLHAVDSLRGAHG